MGNPVHVIALRIALIIEEASPDELGKAIDILMRSGYDSDLLRYLATISIGLVTNPPGKSPVSTMADKPIGQVASKSVLDFEKTNPEKYQVLAEFDRLVQKREVFATNESLRKFGQKISKEFRSGNTFKDNVGVIMATLASMSQHEMERNIRLALDISSRSEADEYRNLANYLIHGHRVEHVTPD